MATKRHEIADGPSKFDLMVSLLDGGRDGVPRRRVHFVFAGGLEMEYVEFIVNSLEREDGSGQNWNFRGFVPVIPHQKNAETAMGFFSTDTRKGWIKINHHD